MFYHHFTNKYQPWNNILLFPQIILLIFVACIQKYIVCQEKINHISYAFVEKILNKIFLSYQTLHYEQGFWTSADVPLFTKYPFQRLDAMTLYNCFLWSQFECRDAKLFYLEEDLSDEYYSLISKFIGENNEYNLRESILRKEFEETDLLEKKPQMRRKRNQKGYEFFESFKHGWRTCSTHGKNMTAKHMVEEHLFGQPGNWQGKLERIQVYVGEIAQPFYSKVQKSMKESAQKLAARIKQLIKTECEPYQKKKLNTMQ